MEARKLRIKAYDEFDAIAQDSSETITEVRVGNFPKRLWYRVRLAAQLHQTHIRVIVIAALTKFLDDLGIEE